MGGASFWVFFKIFLAFRSRAIFSYGSGSRAIRVIRIIRVMKVIRVNGVPRLISIWRGGFSNFLTLTSIILAI